MCVFFFRMVLQETYGVEDCIVTQIPEWSYTSTGTTVQYKKIIDESLNLPSKFVLDFDYKGTNQARTGLFNSSTSENYNIDVQVTTNDYVGIHRSTSTTGVDSGRLTADNTQYHNCQIIVDGTTVTWILGGTNTSSATVPWITSNPLHYLIVEVWRNSATAYIKNLKIKAL